MSFLATSKVTLICHSPLLPDLKPLLTPEAVTELVMVSMKHLPRHQPKTFRSSYTPIAAAGTEAQVLDCSQHKWKNLQQENI